ncbi:Chitin synthase, class 5 [Puccinia graminis f. sp. tritici]|uniref:Chitin synthase, class 5 n=1 Tax=Puccinia graminis f. sp. tritici TaxID=56615 RepID=A0A5B0SAC5_PUCGR|nr:Chitin synthase, class 5 [Puccinia graminis f. sp. tritici]
MPACRDGFLQQEEPIPMTPGKLVFKPAYIGKDNPFSATSPTISNLLPLGNWPSFSQSNSLNHGNFGGLLSAANNQFSPIIGPSTGPALSTGSDNNWATVIPDQPLEEKQDIPEVDHSAGPDQPAALYLPHLPLRTHLHLLQRQRAGLQTSSPGGTPPTNLLYIPAHQKGFLLTSWFEE